MTEKRFQWVYIKDNTLELRDNGIVKVFNNERLEELLNDLVEENEQLKSALKELKEIGDYQCGRINELSDENERLEKGMIEVVDRYIKNVECNPPSSTRTYMKIKGALINIREDLRDLIGDLE